MHTLPMASNYYAVGLEAPNGKIRLRLPRCVARDSARYISTRLVDTPENRQKAQIRAWEIEEDIRNDRLDPTLERYQFRPALTVVSKPTGPSKSLLDLWTLYAEAQRPKVEVTTYQRDYLTLYPKRIRELPSGNPSEVKQWLLEHKPLDTVRRTLVYINACVEWAVDVGLVEENPWYRMAVDVPRPPKREIDPFSRVERRHILEAFQAQRPQYYPFVHFLLLTGCRVGEAIALNWEDIATDYSRIYFRANYSEALRLRKTTKTGKARVFPANPVLSDLLQGLTRTSDDSPVFPGVTGGRLSNTMFTNQIWRGCTAGRHVYQGIVTELVKEGKVERYRSPYNCRHTVISMLLEEGLSVQQVAKLVGNTPKVIWEHYAGSTLSLTIPEF